MMRLCPIRYGGYVEPTPPIDPYLISLLHFDGDFTDETGIVYSIDGTPTISSTQFKFGGESMYRDGSGSNYPYYFSNIATTASTAWTFEFWFYGTYLPSTFNTIFQLYNGDPALGGGLLPIAVDGWTGYLRPVSADPGTQDVSGAMMNHIALCTLGNDIWLYGNGVLSATIPQTLFPGGLGWCIGGAKNNGGDSQNGYYDEFRALIGDDSSACAYPNGTTFTPPTGAFSPP